jgi:hypothetical protein
MGKYTHLRGELDPAPQDQTWQQRINVKKSKFNGVGLGALGEAYNKKREQKERLEEDLGDVNTELEALSQLMLSKMEDDGLQNVRLADGSTIYINDRPYCQVQSQEDFLRWIRETQREELLSVHYQKMNSLVSELLIEGQPPPPGIKAFLKTSLGRRRG